MLEVSPGYSPEGRIFETPQRDQSNEEPRYLAFLGSLIDPETARSRWWTKGGGLEITNPCLRYVKNFIRKGRITPLLKDTHDYLPFDYVSKMIGTNPLGAGYFPQPVPQGYVPPALPPSQGQFQPGFGAIAVGGPSPYGSLVGKVALPGEQVHSILNGPENMTQTNIRRGAVELTSLKGHIYRPQQIDEVYVDPTIWQIQRSIFPTYPVLPVLLDDLERLLDEAEQHTSLQSVVAEMHESLIAFRDYADATIQQVHSTMKESAGRSGYVFRYTSMDLVLLEQLGAERQDRQIRQQAQQGGGIQKSDLVDILTAFQQSNREERAMLISMLKGNVVSTEEEPVINEKTMMAAAPTEFDNAGADTPREDTILAPDGEQFTNATPEGQEQMADAMTNVESAEPEPEVADESEETVRRPRRRSIMTK